MLMEEVNLNTIINLLKDTQSANVNEAEKSLMELSLKNGFLNCMYEVLQNPTQSWLGTVAATTLNRALSQKLTQYPMEQLFLYLMKILFDPKIKDLDKRCLERTIITILETSEEKLIAKWQQACNTMLLNKATFDPAFLIIASFAVADISQEYLFVLFRNTFELTLISLEVCLQNAGLLNELIKTWIVFFDKFRQMDSGEQYLNSMATCQPLLNLIDMIYELGSQSQQVYLTLNPQLLELNLLRYEAADRILFQIFVVNKRILEHAAENQVIAEKSFGFLNKNISKIIRTLYAVGQNIKLLETLQCEDLITTFISIEIIYVENTSHQIIDSQWQNLQRCIIFPFLIINDGQRASFQDCPEEFNSLAEDCCDKQTFGILKTETCKLLEVLADKSANSLTFGMRWCLESLKVRLGFVMPNNNQQKYLEIETAFLILSIFSYKISNYPQETEELRVIFCDEQKMKNLGPLQTSRFLFFLAYNYSDIYSKPQDGQLWISYALSYNKHPTGRYSALDFLSNIADQYFTQKFLISFSDLIPSCKIGLIWDIATKIIENHAIKISSEGFQYFIFKINQRIKGQLGALNSESQQNRCTLNIVNCVHLFRSMLQSIKLIKNGLMEQKGYSQVNQGERINNIKNLIWEVMQLYPRMLKIELEDQLIRLLVDYVNCESYVEEKVYQILPVVLEPFKKNGYFEKVYIRLLNQIVIKGNFDLIIQSNNVNKSGLEEVLIVLKTAFMTHLMEIYNQNQDNMSELKKKKVNQNQKYALGAIIVVLQNFLAIHGETLLQINHLDLFYELSSMSVRMLPGFKETAQKNSTAKILMSRAFNLLFLCHMHLRADNTFQYLAMLEKEDIYHGYDTKVIVACICKEIFKQTDLEIITILLNSLVNIASASQNKDKLIAKKKKNKDHVGVKVMQMLKKISDFQKILQNIDTPFQNERSTSIWKPIVQCVSKMIKMSPENYFLVYDKLEKDVKIKIDSLLEEKKKERVIRKVVGIKDHVEIRQNQNNEDIEGEEEEDNLYKRARKVKKNKDGRKYGKKGKKAKIVEENNFDEEM